MTYRDHLQGELRRRQMTNPRYSLRSFAKALGLSPAYVSKLLRGQKTLSLDKAMQVCDRLQYSEAEALQFCQLVQQSRVRSPELKRILRQEGSEDDYQPLGLEAMEVVADWYHLALHALTECSGFKPTPEYIAARLNISVRDAKLAIDRMVRLGLLHETTLKKTAASVSAMTSVPLRAMRNFHHQILVKAKDSIEAQTMDERDISGMTMSVSPEKIDLAREEIKRFRRRMNKLMDSSRPTEVYQLSVQFFRLTEPKDKSK